MTIVAAKGNVCGCCGKFVIRVNNFVSQIKYTRLNTYFSFATCVGINFLLLLLFLRCVILLSVLLSHVGFCRLSSVVVVVVVVVDDADVDALEIGLN